MEITPFHSHPPDRSPRPGILSPPTGMRPKRWGAVTQIRDPEDLPRSLLSNPLDGAPASHRKRGDYLSRMISRISRSEPDYQPSVSERVRMIRTRGQIQAKRLVYKTGFYKMLPESSDLFCNARENKPEGIDCSHRYRSPFCEHRAHLKGQISNQRYQKLLNSEQCLHIFYTIEIGLIIGITKRIFRGAGYNNCNVCPP